MVAGRVVRVGVKPRTPGKRGFPKPAVPSAEVTAQGLAGDHNVYRTEKLRGDPDSAVLLLAEEVLAALQGEGWPVRPGDLGENVLTRGVDHAAMGPGTRWRVGAAEVQVARACDPCDNLYALPYVGAARGPAFLKAMTGRRGWYARVLAPGRVATGDPVEAL